MFCWQTLSTCSWKPVFIPFLMISEIPMHAYQPEDPFLLSLISGLKVMRWNTILVSFLNYGFSSLKYKLLTIFCTQLILELKGATPELLKKLIPEHIRQQESVPTIWMAKFTEKYEILSLAHKYGLFTLLEWSGQVMTNFKETGTDA